MHAVLLFLMSLVVAIDSFFGLHPSGTENQAANSPSGLASSSTSLFEKMLSSVSHLSKAL